MNLKELNTLIKIANDLDNKHLYREADIIDSLILKLGSGYYFDDDDEEEDDPIQGIAVREVGWRCGDITSNERQGGVWFADKKEDSEKFMLLAYNQKGSKARPYQISLNNAKFYRRYWGYIPNAGPERTAWSKDLMNKGYDGVVIGEDTWWDSSFQETSITGRQFVVFDPNQVNKN